MIDIFVIKFFSYLESKKDNMGFNPSSTALHQLGRYIGLEGRRGKWGGGEVEGGGVSSAQGSDNLNPHRFNWNLGAMDVINSTKNIVLSYRKS